MATANHGHIESTISSEAIGLLDCFSQGMDEVVYQIAEAVAAQRLGRINDVEITPDDIGQAANLLLVALKGSNIPDAAKPEIEKMLVRLQEKLKTKKR